MEMFAIALEFGMDNVGWRRYVEQAAQIEN